MENIGRSQKGQGNQGLKNNIDETGEKEKVDMESDFKTRVWTGASRDFFFSSLLVELGFRRPTTELNALG